MVKSWKLFQRMKWRLEYMERDLRTAEAEVTALRLRLEATREAGLDTQELEEALGRALSQLAAVDDPSRIAARTLQAVHTAEAGMGRLEVAYLTQQLGGEAEAVAFFERLTRDRAAWDMMTRAGFRQWLRAVRRARQEGAHAPLPGVCR
jgi:hypothetical protein